MRSPLIFDIKRASTVDGPGVRTAVFFKGCNLDCYWCHNPEGKKAGAEVAFFEEKCISCGTCREKCTNGDACIACGVCVACCPAEAKRLYGTPYSAEALAELLLRDRAYYAATGGGVTFSGGECMLYPDYLAAVARICKAAGVHMAVDTAGHVPWESFARVLPFVDLFLYDVKCLDPVLHKRGTGVDNALILQNLERLIGTDKEIAVRTPVIPDFNEGEECARVCDYCAARGLAHELLPYHSFGEDKLRALTK